MEESAKSKNTKNPKDLKILYVKAQGAIHYGPSRICEPDSSIGWGRKVYNNAWCFSHLMLQKHVVKLRQSHKDYWVEIKKSNPQNLYFIWRRN